MVEIYGTNWCTYCKKAVSLCESSGIQFSYTDVDDTANLRALEERIGSQVKSVPQIFMDGRFLPGGYTGLQQELVKS